ncbi:MAG: AMP-binding protein, partial [Acutalibacteraceae bacterium]|nr:AMP-binding protein [Acutalibacteraceae bacterium]
MADKKRNEIYAPATKSFYTVREFSTVKELMRQTEELYGSNNAFEIKLKEGSRFITYKEYCNEINALGTALLSMGYKGKHLAISANNRYEWCLSYMAIINGVGVAVPIDKELLFPDINGILETSDSSLIFCDKQLLSILERDKMNPDITIVCFDYEE